jgi:ribosome-interacting GTPase 1
LPANLPPQYFDAEKRYRLARTPQEKILALEEMLRIMPKHKGTEKLQGELRRKISKLRTEGGRRSGAGRRTDMYYVEKVGAGQVAMAGPANAGKSRLLAALTNARPEVAEFPFTTRLPQSGVMRYQNVRIQLVDLPPLHPELTEPWVLAVVRNCDALWVVVDLADDNLLEDLESVLGQLTEAGIQLVGKEREEEEEDRLPKRVLLVGNKIDRPGAQENARVLEGLYGEKFPVVGVSAEFGTSLHELQRATFELLEIIRAYTKAPGKDPDLQDPVILPRGSTVLDFAEQIHKDFAEKLKFARIWGPNKHGGQRVQRDYPLTDGDILELHI